LCDALLKTKYIKVIDFSYLSKQPLFVKQ